MYPYRENHNFSFKRLLIFSLINASKITFYHILPKFLFIAELQIQTYGAKVSQI